MSRIASSFLMTTVFGDTSAVTTPSRSRRLGTRGPKRRPARSSRREAHLRGRQEPPRQGARQDPRVRVSSVRSAGDVVRQFWGSVWTEGNASELLALLDPGFQENGEPIDPAVFASAVTSWRETFPDFSATVEELFELPQGRVVTRVTYRGTQHRSWATIPSTGRSFEGVGLDLFTVRDERIVDLWHAADHYDMALQLGGTIAPARADNAPAT